jgi:hypothetical protein
MSIEVIHDQNHPVDLGISVVEKIFDEPSPVLASPPLGDSDLAPARQGLKGQKQSTHTITPILIVVAFHGAGLAGSRGSYLFQQLLRALVHTHHRPQGVLRTTINLQNVLHTADKLGIVLRRDTPTLLQMWLDLVFLSVRRTVS